MIGGVADCNSLLSMVVPKTTAGMMTIEVNWRHGTMGVGCFDRMMMWMMIAVK